MNWRRSFPFVLMASMPVLLGACQILSGLSDLDVKNGAGGAGGATASSSSGGLGGGTSSSSSGDGGSSGSSSSSGGPSKCGDGIKSLREHCGFKSLAPFMVGKTTTDIVTAELTGDNVIDIAVGCGDGTITIFKGTGNGNFSEAGSYGVTGSPISDIESADVDGDLLMDIVGAYESNGSIVVLRNKGNSSFAQSTLPGVGAAGVPIRIAIGDVDAQPGADLVVRVALPYNKVTVHSNMVSSPYFSASSVTITDTSGVVDSDLSGLAVFPFDPDAKKEIVISDSGLQFVKAFADAAMGSATSTVPYPEAPSPTALATGDIDGDKDEDVVVLHYSTNEVAPIRNDSGVLKDSMASYSVGMGPAAVLAVDMNRDSVADIVVINQLDQMDPMGDTLSLLLNKGDGTFESAQSFDVLSNPTGIAVGDFNGDGLMDIAVSHFNDDNFVVLIANPL